MNHETALQTIGAHPAIESFRRLCHEDNPNIGQRDAYRGLVQQLASGHQFPSAATQASNAIAAVGRVASAVLTGQAVMASPEVKAERLAICQACEAFDVEHQRCKMCGCTMVKLMLATEKCPLGKWAAV